MTDAAVGELEVDEALEARRLEIARALAKAEARIARRIEAIRGDLARQGDADAAALRGALFVAEAARAPRGAKELVAIDWSSGEPLEARLELDPARGAREQVDAIFKRARRLKQGAAIAERRLHDAERAARVLQTIASHVTTAPARDQLEALARDAKAKAPRDLALAIATPAPRGGADFKRAREAKATPHRTFRDAEGAPIFVGRSGEHNDALAFKVARPHDLWLHAKNRAGAHVVVPLDKSKPCAPERLVDAAHLAAHFSEARGEAIVEVQHTPRRYLRKPRGSAPGLVVVDREKVLVLRVEPARVERLLATEER